MIVRIPQVLTAEELANVRERLAKASWVDGRVTAGHQNVKVKSNLQLAEDSQDARELGAIVMRGLERNTLFMSAALPRHVYPPMFNRYEPGMNFGTHIDGAIRQIGSPIKLSETAAVAVRAARPAGADTDAILKEIGLSL